MSLLAIQYRLVPESPILVAANREAYLDRPNATPSIQSGKPRILCGVDQRTGGTWLGVNQHGLFVGLCPRKTESPIYGSKSRSVLVREVLKSSTSEKGVDKALEELSVHRFEGFNLIIADHETGWFIKSEDDHEVVRLEEGLNIVGSHELNDPRDERVQLARRLLTLQTLDSPVKFLAVASQKFARSPVGEGRPSMVVRNPGFGTVSSTLIALSPKPRDAIFQYAAGAPDSAKYEDYSPLLRDILSRGLRESRTKAAKA
ncbi:MAG: hypothetical protein RLY14_1246 [Planctomycetota bacterium]|jgi:hypothetical protein